MSSSKTVLLSLLFVASSLAASAVELSLDSCRTLALNHNKELLIQGKKVEAAGYQRREAWAAYLPAIDFNGGYTYNQRNISMFDKDQLLPTKSFNPKTGTYEYNLVTNPATGYPVKGPNGEYIPSTVALIPKEAMEFDIHHVAFGAVTLTQPVFMGGKIVALNRMAKYAESLSKDMESQARQDVIYAVDAAYWQVVSLAAKHELAKTYVELLSSLDNNVQLMVEQGVATKSDKLTVDVKLNEAQIDLTKVENGLVLSRMLLAQLCGLPVDSPMHLADEAPGVNETSPEAIPVAYDMEQVYASRSDLRALENYTHITDQQKRVALSSMLPTVAVVGAYSVSNPNMFNGFSKRFDGGFSVGVMVSVPIWHWGGNYNKYRVARAQQQVAMLQLDDAKEKINLQVTQAAFKAREAMKTYLMTISNSDKASENLENARTGFKEGVLTTDNVLAAQTAWLKARSEKIDAMIDVQLCDVYLNKVLGRMNY